MHYGHFDTINKNAMKPLMDNLLQGLNHCKEHRQPLHVFLTNFSAAVSKLTDGSLKLHVQQCRYSSAL